LPLVHVPLPFLLATPRVLLLVKRHLASALLCLHPITCFALHRVASPLLGLDRQSVKQVANHWAIYGRAVADSRVAK
jgi:hypothetical protein